MTTQTVIVTSRSGPASCPPPAPLGREPLDRAEAETLAKVIKALADPTRLQILSLIRASPDGEVCVCNLTGPLGFSQPTVSHHLKILADAGLLGREKRGPWAWYSVRDDHAKISSDLVAAVLTERAAL